MAKDSSVDNVECINDNDIIKKYIVMNDKEYIITTVFEDENYGKIVKAISKKLKDFERIYFIKSGDNYVRIIDAEILEYIKENYEKIESDIVY